ncbi:hypothetical protein ZOSMA_427G00140 [Zostera marina]|uniref:DUF8204 domain-containing protein n=1 Tax=Zostera marina TaxID=29655 RepID=A0A0K9P4M4_ZOSMR|nr:hypothetical protein ZOSMA_427G00140 [Zostera marina]
METSSGEKSGGRADRTSPSTERGVAGAERKGRSCKGFLYYSSQRKSSNGKPMCFGLNRTLENVPGYMIAESQTESKKEGRNLSDFKYSCIGYSVCADNKNSASPTNNNLENPLELPFCVGIEILVDKRATSNADHLRTQQGAQTQPGVMKQPNSPVCQEHRSRCFWCC